MDDMNPKGLAVGLADMIKKLLEKGYTTEELAEIASNIFNEYEETKAKEAVNERDEYLDTLYYNIEDSTDVGSYEYEDVAAILTIILAVEHSELSVEELKDYYNMAYESCKNMYNAYKLKYKVAEELKKIGSNGIKFFGGWGF